jgi:hypothetical protein
VSGNVAVFGGQATDNLGRSFNIVFEVSDHPDGIIVDSNTPTPCDTTGFGERWGLLARRVLLSANAASCRRPLVSNGKHVSTDRLSADLKNEKSGGHALDEPPLPDRLGRNPR